MTTDLLAFLFYLLFIVVIATIMLVFTWISERQLDRQMKLRYRHLDENFMRRVNEIRISAGLPPIPHSDTPGV